MNCRCCNSSDLKLVLDLGDQPWGNNFIPVKSKEIAKNYPLKVYFCKNCKMVQLDYAIPKEEMFVNHTYLSGTTSSLRKHFLDVTKYALSKTTLKNKNYVLDIGGNDGTFLEHFKNLGHKVLNVDSGLLQSKKCLEKGIPCLNNFFNEKLANKILSDFGHASIIHGSGIFFHLEELHSVFSGIKKLLDPKNGLLIAEFIYLPDMIENVAYDQIYHEHLLYYSLSSFQRLLDFYDLEIVDAIRKPIHGGSCVALIRHKGNTKKSKELKELLNYENVNGFNSIEIYLEFAEKVKVNKELLRGILIDLKKRGKSIVALGAPVKGSTLINYCNLTINEIDYGVEINPHKCGTFYPGTSIPVFHQDSKNPPDYFLLLSWNFKDEILAKINPILENGTKVIVPIPTPRILK